MAKNYSIFPLERILKLCSEDEELSQAFPKHNINYYETYLSTLNELRNKVYPEINLGLAVKSGDVGIYTDHGPEHFDEVVKFAGTILGICIEDIPAVAKIVEALKSTDGWHLSAYEIYLLLNAIRFHDTGNIFGREDHEKKILTVMNTMNNIGLDSITERRIIESIARAHGGKISENNRDTIGVLPQKDKHNKCNYKPQLIAAIVRMADELCEGSSRACQFITVPEGNEAFLEYAKSITQCDLADGNLEIQFSIEKKNAITLYGKNKSKTYLTDEVFKRLDKMELERRYCNMFFPPELQIRRFVATLSIWENHISEDDITEHKTLENQDIEVSESGYPGDMRKLVTIYEKLSGCKLKEKFGP